LIVEHNLPRPHGLIECETVLDVGAGVRPMNWYKPTRHICVEPCEQYAKHLTEAGYEVIGKTALEALRTKRKGHAVYLLDVIEHMEKNDALEVIRLAQIGARQVVLFTPVGFMEQDSDGWGLGEDSWQTHRSGWLPREFPDWQTSFYGRGFYAIWTSTLS